MAFSNNVIGPFSRLDWKDMLETKEKIKYMLDTDPEFYRDAIRKEKNILKEDFFSRIAA